MIIHRFADPFTKLFLVTIFKLNLPERYLLSVMMVCPKFG